MNRIVVAVVLSLIAIALHAQTSLPIPDHIVIVIDENKGYTNVIGSPNAPYINALAKRGALLTSFFASHHPSQPNYIDFFAGDTLGVCDDTCPTSPFAVDNLAAALGASGKSFIGFAENLPAHASTVCKVGTFARKHCPWLDFSNIPSSASKGFSQFPQDAAGFANLPTVSLVIPNLVNDMHNGTAIATEVKAGDQWLKRNLDAYATWAESNNSLLIVTWDEDSNTGYTIKCPDVITTNPPDNHIATIVVGQPVKAGDRSTVAYSHHDLLRTILDMYGIAPFGGAVSATDINDIWRTGTAAVAASTASVFMAAHPGPGTPGSSSTPGCGDGLWQHVYHPNRLLVKQQCITVTGTIVDATAGREPDGVRHEADGDTHGWLKVDPQFTSLLNAGNRSKEGGNLVFEIVCHFPVTQADAKPACKNFSDSTGIPPVGTHVAITGSFVQDTNHSQWNEIHPVSSITVK